MSKKRKKNRRKLELAATVLLVILFQPTLPRRERLKEKRTSRTAHFNPHSPRGERQRAFTYFTS